MGRNLPAETDYQLRTEIYSYWNTKGPFAGINLGGTKWEVDAKANKAVYGEGRAGDVRRLLGRSGARAAEGPQAPVDGESRGQGSSVGSHGSGTSAP